MDESEPTCNRCGNYELQRRGYVYLTTGKYQRYRCLECGGWSRATAREAGIPLRGI